MAALLRILTAIFGTRVFLGGLFMTIIAVVGYNLVVEILDELMAFTLTEINSIDAPESGTVAQISGFGAWVADKLKLHECLAFITSVVAVKWLLRKIPIFRW